MKKIYESPLNGWGESAERIHVYAIDNYEEYWTLEEMSTDELEEHFGLYNTKCNVVPGRMFYRYHFEFTCNHVIITEIIAYDV